MPTFTARYSLVIAATVEFDAESIEDAVRMIYAGEVVCPDPTDADPSSFELVDDMYYSLNDAQGHAVHCNMVVFDDEDYRMRLFGEEHCAAYTERTRQIDMRVEGMLTREDRQHELLVMQETLRQHPQDDALSQEIEALKHELAVEVLL